MVPRWDRGTHSKATLAMLASRHLPADWHGPPLNRGRLTAARPSTRFAPHVCMTPISHSIRHVADIVERAFPRIAIVIVGLIMMAVGLGMTASIVLLPAGIVVALLGVAILVGGVFAPDFRSRPHDGR